MVRLIVVLGLLFGAAIVAVAQDTKVELVATTQPTTTPAANLNVTVKTESAVAPVPTDSVYDEMLKTKIAQIMKGERKLTIQDIKTLDFWVDTIRELVTTVLSFIPRLIGTLVFLLVFYLVYRGIRKMAVGNMKKQEVDSSIRELLGGLIKWTVMGFGIVIACNQLGIPIVAMLTGVSIIGLAVGFAAQETLANFIAGIVIFLDKPFKVGDWIQVGDQQGAVRRITFRSTRFTNLDNDVVVMPNTKILSDQIINKSTNILTRVNVPIGIGYKESIEKARTVLIATVKDDPRIDTTRPPEVLVRACAASSVDLMLHFWIREERYQDAMVWEYLERAKVALDAAGIEIPFPHVQLLLEDTPAVARLSARTAPTDAQRADGTSN